MAAGTALAYLALIAWTEFRPGGRFATDAAPAPSAIRAEFELTDHLGQPRDDQEFRGRSMLVFFGFTNCPDVCPTGLATIARVMDDLGDDAGQLQPLFISIDPERDTPEAMAQYVTAFHPGIIGLTGSTEQISATAANFRVYYERIDEAAAPDGYTMDHTAAIYLIGPGGAFVKSYSINATVDEVVADLRPRLEI
jgi:protein SCO1/2